jgi:hypothetical protein
MSERRYAKADDEERARILDAARIDPSTVAPFVRREAKDRGRDAVPPEPHDEDLYDERTDLGPIDPLLRR